MNFILFPVKYINCNEETLKKDIKDNFKIKKSCTTSNLPELSL